MEASRTAPVFRERTNGAISPAALESPVKLRKNQKTPNISGIVKTFFEDRFSRKTALAAAESGRRHSARGLLFGNPSCGKYGERFE
ncbi:MAG: hypothetical protein RLY70_4017 [Planctomycetota bacterium]|jgi:hypothetical protein